MRLLVARATTVALAAILASCSDDDAFSPTTDNVAGSYSAATFTVTSPAGTVDLLALGAQVDVTLSTDGATTGHLFAPGGGENGEDLEADLTGTWTLTGSTVTFDQEGDTFIRDVEFTATRDQLTGEGTFEDETVRLVLAKSDQ
jgi:hypothetical protein